MLGRVQAVPPWNVVSAHSPNVSLWETPTHAPKPTQNVTCSLTPFSFPTLPSRDWIAPFLGHHGTSYDSVGHIRLDLIICMSVSSLDGDWVMITVESSQCLAQCHA